MLNDLVRGRCALCLARNATLRLCAIQLCRAMDVSYVVAPYEADSQMAHLWRTKKVSAIITEDSDLIAFGCDKVGDWDCGLDGTFGKMLCKVEHPNRAQRKTHGLHCE
jgi:hypothetical protein